MQTIILAYTLLIAASGLLTQVQNSPNVSRETSSHAQMVAQNAIDFATYVIESESKKDTPFVVEVESKQQTGSPVSSCEVSPVVELSPAYGKELGFGGKTKMYSVRVTAKSPCQDQFVVDFSNDSTSLINQKLPFETQVFNPKNGIYTMSFTVHNLTNSVSSTTSVVYEGGGFTE